MVIAQNPNLVYYWHYYFSPIKSNRNDDALIFIDIYFIWNLIKSCIFVFMQFTFFSFFLHVDVI